MVPVFGAENLVVISQRASLPTFSFTYVIYNYQVLFVEILLINQFIKTVPHQGIFNILDIFSRIVPSDNSCLFRSIRLVRHAGILVSVSVVIIVSY